MPFPITHATVDFTLDPPKQGSLQINFRAVGPDKNMIMHAAAALGMNQADFLRYASVFAAREVVKQRDAYVALHKDSTTEPVEGAALSESDKV